MKALQISIVTISLVDVSLSLLCFCHQDYQKLSVPLIDKKLKTTINPLTFFRIEDTPISITRMKIPNVHENSSEGIEGGRG